MKKLFLIAMIGFVTNANAKIWRVNNNAGVSADFTSLQSAIDAGAVLNGDTLHIEPSATDYGGGISLTKQLTIIGAGYFLDPANSGNANLQYTTLESTVNYIDCNNGSNGSKFLGIRFTYALQFYLNSGPANITVEKCQLAAVLFGQTFTFSNVTFRKCFFKNLGGGLNQLFYIQGSPVLANFTFENCIVEDMPLDFSILGTGTNIVRNNVFYYSGGGINYNVNNAYFANNVINYANNFNFTGGTVVKNNFFSNAGQPLPGGAVNNQVGIAASSIFTLTGSTDARFLLKAGSPAVAAGVTISSYTPDCGAYGATDPYKLSGIPNIPSIYLLTVPSSINQGSNMPVTISSTNNN